MTIAEEGGNGKDILLKKGAYKDMDACLMCKHLLTPQLIGLTINSKKVPSCSWAPFIY